MATVEDVAAVLQQLPLRAAENAIPDLPGVDFAGLWMQAAADPECMTPVLEQLLGHIEALINAATAPDGAVPGSFVVYEQCFQAVSLIAQVLTTAGASRELIKCLSSVAEAYDSLLKVVDTCEYEEPGCSGLLRMYMLQILSSLFGGTRITGRHVMELTNNDTSVAVSLMAWVLRCAAADFSIQEMAGRALAQLSTADSVFLPVAAAREAGATNDQQLAELTTTLNQHVDGLIQSVIQYEVVDAFGRCICQHQQSHVRTDVLIKNFFATVHNCLLYCANSQKHLRTHLALHSSIVKDIMFPYVDNILPALYDMPIVTMDTIEFSNLKSAVQTFVVVTFSVDVFRRDFLNDDIIFRMLEVPQCMNYVGFLEVVIRLCINVSFDQSQFFPLVQNKLQEGYNALPPDMQARLQLRLTRPDFSRALPTAQPSASLAAAFAFVLGSERVQPARSAEPQRAPAQCFGMQPSAGGDWDLEKGGPASDDDMPGLAPVAAPTLMHSGPQTGRVCELSGVLLTDPVTTPDGRVFERATLEAWLNFSPMHPLTGVPLTMAECTSADAVRQENMAYQVGVLSAAVLAAEEKPAEPAPVQQMTGPSLLGDLPTIQNDPGVAAAEKEKKKKSKIRITSRKLIDAPEEMRCSIDGKICTNPLRSIYGHVFEKKTLEKWFQSCGSVCPVTQKPLKMEECQPDSALKKQIIKWLKETGQA